MELRKAKLRPIGTKLPEETIKILDQFCEKNDLKKAWVINAAILKLVAEYKKTKVK